MTNRKLKDFGLEPILGYILILTGFIGLSLYLFHKTEFAQYAYILISLALTSILSETTRNEFLKLCFNENQYKIVTSVEKILAALPFLIFLLYKESYVSSIFLVVLTLLLGSSSYRTNLNYSIPTPFFKKPFEFPVGFRNSIFSLLIAYILTVIAITIDNFNLGIFSLMLIFMVVISYYPKPENEYYVWSFTLTPKQFLMEKTKIALFFTSLICLPIILSLGFFYYASIGFLLVIYAVGCIFLMTIIFAKYASYPDQMNIPEGIIVASCVTFPPLLLVFAPYFYKKSIKKLERYLR